MLLEACGTILGLIQGVLVAFDRRSNWIFYIAQMGVLMAFSVINHLYGDVANDFVYLVIGIIGFVRWGREDKSGISVCSAKERILYCSVIALGTAVLASILRKTDDPLPVLDAFTTVSSFVATWYMVVKKLDTWVIWFINDIFYVVEYFMLPQKAVLLGLLNIVWTGLAVISFIQWNKIKNEQRRFS